MAWVAANPARYAGKVIDNGMCVRFCQVACPSLPHTSHWRRGRKVRGSTDIQIGTVIATFSDAAPFRYENRQDGASHAALYISQDSNGARVFDQWVGHAASERVIRWAQQKKSNDGDSFFVVEVDSA